MKCPNCGAELTDYHCEYCESDFSELRPKTSAKQRRVRRVIINSYEVVEDDEPVHEQNVSVNYALVSPKSRLLALLLAIFLGYFGAHRFYAGRIGMGVAYLFTAGLFGFGWLVDIALIALGRMKDGQGLPIRTW